MERLFQKNEGDSVGLKTEKLILHDITGDDKVFHINESRLCNNLRLLLDAGQTEQPTKILSNDTPPFCKISINQSSANGTKRFGAKYS
jgi:hypothetical protein